MHKLVFIKINQQRLPNSTFSGKNELKHPIIWRNFRLWGAFGNKESYNYLFSVLYRKIITSFLNKVLQLDALRQLHVPCEHTSD